jgi:hypothetical protein
VYLQFANKNVSGVVEGPLLVEAPSSSGETIEEAVENHLAYLWEKSKYGKSTNEDKEARLHPDPDPEMYPKNCRYHIALLEPEVSDFCESQVPNICEQSLKVTINPKLSRTRAGFSWSAVMPVNRSIGGSDTEDVKMDLKSCLEYFAYSSQLDGSDAWFCPVCRKTVGAVTLMSLWSVPDVLLFHLKRFGVRDGVMKKFMGKVDFAEEIDMAPFVAGPQKNEELKFRLFAVVHHIGTMNGGHYIATIHSGDEGWFSYNDDAVYSVSEKTVFADSAYVLLYRRVLSWER